MRIRVKLRISFLIITIITLIVGVVGFYGAFGLGEYLQEIAGKRLPRIQSLLTISESMNVITSSQRIMLSKNSKDQINVHLDKISEVNNELVEAKNLIERTHFTTTELQAWNEFKTAFGKWDSECKTYIGMIQDYSEFNDENKLKDIESFINGELSDSFDAASIMLADMVALDKEIAQTNHQKSITHIKMVEYMTAGIVLFCIILSLLLGNRICHTIDKSLTDIVEKLIKSSNQVASASEELATSGRQLSEGSTEQAASIEETSATIDETSSMIKQNADNTRQANDLSQQATMAATDGAGKMQDMIISMKELKKSSAEIAKIIKVIDEIAFQTNMLALNAAVEAARAGDAGQGFAVVAQEVRNLAQKSAQAAKDTERIIARNIQMSDQGANISMNVNTYLEEIMTKTESVNQLIGEITVASQEQARGASQIAEGMTQMETVVQNNASTAEESASFAEDLKNQTDELNDIVMMLNRLVKGKKATRIIEDNESKEQEPVEINLDEQILPKEILNEEHIITPDDIIPLNEDDEF